MPHSSFTPLLAIFFSNSSPIVRTLAFDSRSVRALGRDVAVVEGEERRAHQPEELEGDVGLVMRLLHRVAAGRVPGAQEGLAAEGIECPASTKLCQ